ncbi:MAG: DedA family protein [Candidatus Nomurabacteria bacterium]|nr:DedA family protein [Candidatus Nomurabacteria bacterium]
MEETQSIIQTVSGFSYLGVFGIGLVANIFPFIPEELIVLMLGYLASDGLFNPFIVGGLIIVGLFISDCILFYLARRGNAWLYRFATKLGISISPDNNFIKRHAKKIIFFSRFVVQFRFLGPLMAGTVKTKWKTFMMYDFLALLVYVPIVLFLGDYFHDRIARVVEGVGVVRNVILVIMVVLGIIGIVMWLKSNILNIVRKWISSDVKTD